MFGCKTGGQATAAAAPAPPAAYSDDGGGELEALWRPQEKQARKSVEQLLLERKHISSEQLAQAQAVGAQTPGKSIAQILLTMSAASESQILSALAETLGLPFESPLMGDIDPAVFSLLQPDYIRRRMVLPMRGEGEGMLLGVRD